MERINKVEIVTGFSCNNNCLFCSVGDKLRSFDKTTEQVISDMERALRYRPNDINLTGGEPTIRGDIFRLLSFLKERGVQQRRLTTNGRMFSYRNFTDRCIESGLTGAIVSLHCTDEGLHDRLSGVSGAYRQTTRGLENLRSSGLTLDINTVITSETFKLLPRTAEKAKEYARSVCFIFPTIDGHLEKNPGLVPRMGETGPYLREAMETLNRAGIQCWSYNIPACFVPGYEMYTGMMELKTKMFWPEMDTNLDEKRSRDNEQAKACKNCMYRLICPGIMKKYLKIFGEKEVRAVGGEPVRDTGDGY